jgi:hypothetical protein
VVLGVGRLLFILLALDSEGSYNISVGLAGKTNIGSKRVVVLMVS